MSRILAFLALPLLLGGCAAETRFRIASFLFDGVPPPASAREAAAEAGQGMEQGPKAALPATEPVQQAAPLLVSGSTHKPFGDRSCASCHDTGTSNRLRREGNELCFTCHAAVITGKRVVHVPAQAECLLCHLPHKAENVRLLQQPLPDICLMCHAREEMVAVHGEIGECLTCHNPHESDEDRLLDFE